YINFIDGFGVVNRWETDAETGIVSYTTTSCPGASCVQTATIDTGKGKLTFDFTLNGGAWLKDYAAFRNGAKILSGINNYDFSQTCSTCQGSINVRLLNSRINRAGLNTQTAYGYDSPSTANVTSIEEWNYWAGDQNTVAPQVPDRRTIISYKTDSTLTSKNILNRPQSIILRVGLIDQVSQTNYDYDGNPLTPINQSIFNHTDSADVHRGNLTHVARWTGGTSFLDTFLTYDTTGQVVQIKDPAGNPTGLTYTDNFFNDNGTSQLPPVTPSQATNAYPSIVTLPGIGNINLGYYFGTGQQAFVSDPNGQRTYQHFQDPFNRITQTVSPKGWTDANYSSLFSADVFSGITDTQPSVTCSGCVHTQVSYNELGLPLQSTLLSDPAGPVTSATFYDVMGNPTSTTIPVRGTQVSSSTPQTTYSYDVLYRLAKIVHPDKSAANIYYGDDPGLVTAGGTLTQSCPAASYGLGFPILSVDEVGLKRQVWSDAFGNVIEADEPDANNNLTVATCYKYNLGNELTDVAQGFLARSYKYDPLWRVTQVTTPEAGTETFSYLTDSGTLCSGDPGAVCKKVDARGVITHYQYDAAGRLTQKTYSDATPTAVFKYDESSALGGLAQVTNTIGRMSSMYTQDATGKMLAGEAFSYDIAGNVIANPQCTPQNCGTGLFQNNYTPDLLGNIISSSNSWGRTVNATYNNADQLTSLGVTPGDALHPSTVFSNAKYNEFGAAKQLVLGNGLNVLQDFSRSRGWLQTIQVGSLGPTGLPSGNAPQSGETTIAITGALQQMANGPKGGRGLLTISGTERSIAGSGSAQPGTATLTITGAEQSTDVIAVPAVTSTGSLAVTGAIQSKTSIAQNGTTASGTVTVSGTQHSVVVQLQPATSGTDTLTISGTLQSKQKQKPGTDATGSITIGGALANTHVGGAPARQATGSITISGNEQSVTYPGERYCADFAGNPPRCVDWEFTPSTTVNDSGNITVYVDGQSFSYPYGAGDSITTIANSMAASIRNNSTSTDYTSIAINTSVTPPTATIFLVARRAGVVGNNITLGTAATTYDTRDFTSASFNPSVSGTTMSGGVDIDPGTTVYDAGTVTLSVGGVTTIIDYGQFVDPSASEIVADLVSGIKSQLPTTNPPFSIAVTNSTTITIS